MKKMYGFSDSDGDDSGDTLNKSYLPEDTLPHEIVPHESAI